MSLRVISGSAKGRKLKSVPGDSTRPITDTAKEALFDILAGDVIDSRWWDLFGGTGAVGIEALSRGASFVRFTERDRKALDTIRENIEHCRLSDRAEVRRADAFSALASPPDRPFDYVYIAPPQYQEMWSRALEALDSNPLWLSSESWVIVQINPKEYVQLAPRHLVEFDQRKYGSTLLVFYEGVANARGVNMKNCPYCAEQIQDDAIKCRYCGEWLNKPHQPAAAVPFAGAPYAYYYGWNFEYKSEAELFGIPLIHVAQGLDPQTGMPRVARGIIAVGNIAIGGLAIGGVAVGGIALGGMSLGALSLGGVAVGLLAAVGGLALGGFFAMGGVAISLMYAVGGLALAPYYLGGNGVHPEFYRRLQEMFPGMRF